MFSVTSCSLDSDFFRGGMMLPSPFGKCQCTVGIPINKYSAPLFNYHTSFCDVATVVLEPILFCFPTQTVASSFLLEWWEDNSKNKRRNCFLRAGVTQEQLICAVTIALVEKAVWEGRGIGPTLFAAISRDASMSAGKEKDFQYCSMAWMISNRYTCFLI